MHRLAAPALDSPPLQRYGYPELVFGAQPAAGAHFTPSMDGRFHVRLVSLYCKFVADANAASREIVVEYRDAGGLRYALAGINTTVTASNTAYYAFNAFQPEAVATVDSSALVPLPAMILPPTHDFRLYVLNIQATDQLSAIRFVWERFYAQDVPRDNGRG